MPYRVVVEVEFRMVRFLSGRTQGAVVAITPHAIPRAAEREQCQAVEPRPYAITYKANEIETEHNLLRRMVQVTPDFRRAERPVIVLDTVKPLREAQARSRNSHVRNRKP
jgi:hypothetical protein